MLVVDTQAEFTRIKSNMTLTLEQEIAIRILSNNLSSETKSIEHYPNIEFLVLQKVNLCRVSISYSITFLREDLDDIIFAPIELIQGVEAILIKRKTEALLSPVEWIREWSSRLS